MHNVLIFAYAQSIIYRLPGTIRDFGESAQSFCVLQVRASVTFK